MSGIMNLSDTKISCTSGTETRAPVPQKQENRSKVQKLIAKVKYVFSKGIRGKRHQKCINSDLKLSRLCHSLARVSSSIGISDSSKEFHIISWPVQTLREQFSLTVPEPYNGESRPNEHIDLSYFVNKLPESMKMVYTKADPKKLINLMLPGRVICDEARKVAAIFWLWLCITDDILENMNDQDFSKGIRDMHASLAASSAMEHNSTSQISFVTKLFRGVITMTEISGLEPVQQDQWRSNLITCVQEIAHAFELERPLLRLKERVELEDWMKLRVVTISARPFMVLAKASLRILGNMSPMGNPLSPDYQSFQYRENDLADDLTRLETTMQCVLGLQNDILGWEKDHKEGLNLNCVQILIAKSRSSNNVVCTRALNTAIEAHNQLVVSAISRVPKHFKLKDQSKVCVRGSIQSSTDSSVPSLVESSDNSEAASMDSTSCSSTNPHAHQMYQANTFGEYSIEEIDTLEIAQNHGEAVPQQKISLYSSRGVIKASLVAETLGTVTKNEEAEQVRKYVNVLLNMGNGMATWMIGSRRYAIKE